MTLVSRENLYQPYLSRYTDEQLDSRHFGGEHPQPRPAGEVRDRDGRIVLAGRAVVHEECTCPTLRQRIIAEVDIDEDRRIGEELRAELRRALEAEEADRERVAEFQGALAASSWLRDAYRKGRRYHLFKMREIGVRGAMTFHDESDARNRELAEGLRDRSLPLNPAPTEEEREAAIAAWDRPMTDEEVVLYDKQFGAEIAEMDREAIVAALPLD